MSMKLPLLLSVNAGYVDTAAFLALQGLFTAHVTGNFVTLASTLVLGGSGATAKLLALPLFCLVVMLVRLGGSVLALHDLPELRIILGIKVLLLAAAAALALRCGPFADGDAAPALATGMLLVAAMAIQNTINRQHLASTPPTTIMTGNTTQFMMDLADRLHGPPPDRRDAVRARFDRLGLSIIGFTLGCAAGALAYLWLRQICFVVPPVLALAALAIRPATPPVV